MFDIAVHELDQLRARAAGSIARLPLIAPPQPFIDRRGDLPGGRRRTSAMLLRSRRGAGDAFDVPLRAGFANDRGLAHLHRRAIRRSALYLQVADPLDERRSALNRTLLGLIIPLVRGAAAPGAGAAPRSRARELRVLQQLAGEIAQRSGADLRPIALPDLPQELRSVGDARQPPARAPGAGARRRARAGRQRRARAAHAARGGAAAAADRARPRPAARRRAGRARRAADARPPHREAAAALARRVRRPRSRARRSTWSSSPARWRRSSGSDAARERAPDAAGAETASCRSRSATSTRWRSRCATWSRTRCATAATAAVVIEVMRARAPWSCATSARASAPSSCETLHQRHVRHSADRAGYGLGLSIVGTIVDKHGAPARAELAAARAATAASRPGSPCIRRRAGDGDA